VSFLNINALKLSRRAMALLIFLARPARAWFVATDLRLVANNGLDLSRLFSGGGRALVWPSERKRRRPSRQATLTKRLWWFL
jgi:hypothetical protein